jgi:hypothetical protein
VVRLEPCIARANTTCNGSPFLPVSCRSRNHPCSFAMSIMASRATERPGASFFASPLSAILTSRFVTVAIDNSARSAPRAFNSSTLPATLIFLASREAASWADFAVAPGALVGVRLGVRFNHRFSQVQVKLIRGYDSHADS